MLVFLLFCFPIFFFKSFCTSNFICFIFSPCKTLLTLNHSLFGIYPFPLSLLSVETLVFSIRVVDFVLLHLSPDVWLYYLQTFGSIISRRLALLSPDVWLYYLQTFGSIISRRLALLSPDVWLYYLQTFGSIISRRLALLSPDVWLYYLQTFGSIISRRLALLSPDVWLYYLQTFGSIISRRLALLSPDVWLYYLQTFGSYCPPTSELNILFLFCSSSFDFLSFNLSYLVLSINCLRPHEFLFWCFN